MRRWRWSWIGRHTTSSGRAIDPSAGEHPGGRSPSISRKLAAAIEQAALGFSGQIAASPDRLGEIRYQVGLHALHVRVDEDPDYSSATLVLPPDDLIAARLGRARPSAQLRVPPGLSTEELANALVRAGARMAAERASTASRLRRLIWYRQSSDRLVADGLRPRLWSGDGPGDRQRLAGLAARLHHLADPARVAVGDDLRLVDDLAGLGVLLDQDGAAARGERLRRRMRRMALSPAARTLVRQRIYDSRADPSTIVDAVGRAAAGLRASVPGLRGAKLEEAMLGAANPTDADVPVLRMLVTRPGATTAHAEIVRLQIEVVPVPPPGRTWPAGLVDSVAEVRPDEEVLRVRANAGDAALRVDLAGHMARWLAGADSRSADGPDMAAVLAERDALLRQRGSSRWARWLRWSEPTSWRDKVFDDALGRLRTRISALAAEPDRSPDSVRALRAVLDARVPGRPGPTPAIPNPAAGLELHQIRRGISASSQAMTTVVAGLSAHRHGYLIAASAAGTGAAAPTQGWSDAANSAMSHGPELPADLLVSPGVPVPTGPYRRPRMPGPKANYTKRSVAGLAQAGTSLVALAAATHSVAIGGKGTALTIGANAGQAHLDHIFDHPENIAAKRYAHQWARTFDARRNGQVESAYYSMRALVERVAMSGAATSWELPARIREDLIATRAVVGQRMASLDRQVDSNLGEMFRRRRWPFRFSSRGPTYDLIVRGVTSGAPRVAHNAIRVGGQQAASQIPSLVLGQLAHSATDLVTTNMIAAGLSGAVYGAGWSLLKRYELADLAAVASWDARDRWHYIGAAIDYLLAPAEQRPPSPMPIDASADPGRYRLALALGLTRLAAALAQGRANRLAGRPNEVSARLQFWFKHIPTTIAHVIVAGVVGGLGFPAGTPVGVVVGLGGATKVVVGIGETALRVPAPLFAQVARIQQALTETAATPLTRAELAARVRQLVVEAGRNDARIQPVERLGRRTVIRQAVAGRWSRLGYGARRIVTRVGGATDRARPPVLTPSQPPAATIRLTQRDRAEVNQLYRLALDLDHALDDRRNARADLQPGRLGVEAVVMLDRLGLRRSQDAGGRRWTAVRADLRGRYGYRAGVLTLLRDHTDGTGIARWALDRAARDDSRTAELRAAVDQAGSSHRYVVRSPDQIKVFPLGGHRFRLQIAVRRPSDGIRAELRLAPDDLWHAITNTVRDEPHQLTVDPTDVQRPARLAEILNWATDQVVAARGPRAHRSRALLFDPASLTVALAAAPLADPPTPAATQAQAATPTETVPSAQPDRPARIAAGPAARDARFAILDPAVPQPRPTIDQVLLDRNNRPYPDSDPHWSEIFDLLDDPTSEAILGHTIRLIATGDPGLIANAAVLAAINTTLTRTPADGKADLPTRADVDIDSRLNWIRWLAALRLAYPDRAHALDATAAGLLFCR